MRVKAALLLYYYATRGQKVLPFTKGPAPKRDKSLRTVGAETNEKRRLSSVVLYYNFID